MENRKSVLLADASEEFRHLFAGALAEEDDIVLIGETGDGQEAVRLAREQQPDVMVMDLVLSRMDGLEVLQALAGQSPRPRVLVLSSFARGNMAELAASCGADYYMMKPCKLSTVIERIRQNSVRFRRDDDVAARRELEAMLDALSREQTIQVARAFSYFSHLANIAEDQHHIRRSRAHLIAGSTPREGSLAHAVAKALDDGAMEPINKALSISFGLPDDHRR